MDKPVFRFAPSPNGELHLGHAFSALVGYERARAGGGRFLVRIEDIDKGRARARYIAGILADLAWLGVAWEEPVVFQSQRLPAYRAASERLERMGLLYPCFATRGEIAAAASHGRDPDGAPLYPGLYKGSGGRPVRSCTRRMIGHLRRSARTPSRTSLSSTMILGGGLVCRLARDFVSTASLPPWSNARLLVNGQGRLGQQAVGAGRGHALAMAGRRSDAPCRGPLRGSPQPGQPDRRSRRATASR